ncbi:MAG: hypothetical protein HC936_11225 [Leptolyngbyaceae cyanobacterium SU_3_3]|nr:hypothetical protein [Leptolyngbyaceae cyanobacterium SU_3_3]
MSKLFQRRWIFVFVLIFLVTFGSVTATHSQTPSSRDAAIAEIKSLAASDVETEVPRRTKYAIELYGSGKTPGLSDRDIGKIYDQEYSQKDKEKKAGLARDSVQEWLGGCFRRFSGCHFSGHD